LHLRFTFEGHSLSFFRHGSFSFVLYVRWSCIAVVLRFKGNVVGKVSRFQEFDITKVKWEVN